MNKESRLHPVYLLFTLYEWIKGTIPIIVILYLRLDQIPVWLRGWGVAAAVLLILLFIGWGVLGWRRFIYTLEEDRLVIRKGVLIRDEKSLYFGRIHSVSMEQPLLQRLLGVVQIRIETPGGGPKSDGLLPAVSSKEAQRLQQWLRQQQQEAQRTGDGPEPTAADAARVHEDPGSEAGPAGAVPPTVEPLPDAALLLRLTPGEMAKAAFSSMNIGMVAAFVGGIYSLLNDFIQDNIYERIFKETMAHLPGSFAILTAVCALLLFAWLLSSILFILRFGGFTVSRDGEQLVVAHGLLERRKTVFSPARVQAVVVKEGLLRQLLGYAEVELTVIASTKQEKLTLHPWVRTRDIPALLSEVVPQFTVHPVTAGAPRRALLYYFRFKLLAAAAVCAALIGYFHLPGLWSLLMLPLMWFWGLQCYRDAGMHLSGGQLTLRRRVLLRETCYVRRPQILTVTASGSLSQRKRKLRSLRVHIMGGGSGTSFKVRCLDEADVQTVWRWFSRSGNGAGPNAVPPVRHGVTPLAGSGALSQRG